MTICCSCGQFKFCSSYAALALTRRSGGSCGPSSGFPPAMRWRGGRIACPVSPASRSRVRIGRGVRASMVDSYESSSEFVKRMEQAWLISQEGHGTVMSTFDKGIWFMKRQQPGPIACSSCKSNGYVECKWCRGTGFFILGDNMLCEVPSRNTTCVICAGKGSARCSDCKGTGFRAKWLGQPPPTHPHEADQT